jgi:capsular exopolysaccharide synthesis family protein
MYLEHFGLTDQPFALTCDPRYFYESTIHAETLSNMVYTINQRKGMVLVTGEIGAGKTFLVTMLRSRFSPDTILIQIQNPPQSPLQFLRTVAQSLGLRLPEPDSPDAISRDIQAYLARLQTRGRLVALTLDECQDMSIELLEQLRTLANWQADGDRLLQMVLIGQPELREKLLQPQWEPLRQRIVLSYHLGHLSPQDTHAYVKHRLVIAGAETRELFTADALDAVYQATSGTPRLINVLCDNVLLRAARLGKDTIDAELIHQVLREELITDEQNRMKSAPGQTGATPAHAPTPTAPASSEPVKPPASVPAAPTATHAPSPASRPRPVAKTSSSDDTDESKTDASIHRRSGKAKLAVVHNHPGSAIAEEYRSLRTSLLGNAGEERFCYLITSSQPGEGKTVTCLNLALVMAERADHNTILVDFNLRNGRLAKLLHARPSPGMAELLRGSADLSEVVQPTCYPNLSFIPAGTVRPEEVGQLVGGPELDDLVIDLRRQYNYIIFDTPAINVISDAGLLALSTGEALLVARMYKTRRESIENAIRLLHASNVRFAGMILTNRKHFIPNALYRIT